MAATAKDAACDAWTARSPGAVVPAAVSASAGATERAPSSSNKPRAPRIKWINLYFAPGIACWSPGLAQPWTRLAGTVPASGLIQDM
jgi:hypothetical protein